MTRDDWPDWQDRQSPELRRWAAAMGFSAGLGKLLPVPDGDGNLKMAVAGYGTAPERRRGRFHLARVAASLPPGVYRLVGLPPETASEEALGWLLSGYRFERYRKASDVPPARLCAPEAVDAARIERMAAGEFLTRDLINTPAEDMGPAELEDACVLLAAAYDASIEVTRGKALLKQGFPLIHLVGRAAERKPRLIDLRWGDDGPSLTLVGKGVCFDTGGLNLKPGTSMALMKKDMGGAATVLGLARMIMASGLKLRLRVLIPAVENAVAGDAFRPGDIVRARNGLTVEVNNTDAEGRLVLADALALAAEERPDLIVSMATLTGAARVALGPDLSPFFTDDEAVAAALQQAAPRVADPVWRLPLHAPYESMIEPGIADLDNAPKGGFAGSITAALFLRRFTDAQRYLHFDIYGWSPKDQPARPLGAVGMGARAVFEALPDLLAS